MNFRAGIFSLLLLLMLMPSLYARDSARSSWSLGPALEINGCNITGTKLSAQLFLNQKHFFAYTGYEHLFKPLYFDLFNTSAALPCGGFIFGIGTNSGKIGKKVDLVFSLTSQFCYSTRADAYIKNSLHSFVGVDEVSHTQTFYTFTNVRDCTVLFYELSLEYGFRYWPSRHTFLQFSMGYGIGNRIYHAKVNIPDERTIKLNEFCPIGLSLRITTGYLFQL